MADQGSRATGPMQDEMTEPPEPVAQPVELPAAPSRRRRVLKRTLIGSGLGIVAALGAAWFSRDDIADNVIRDTLQQYDLPVRYRIASIGPRHQVIEDVVVGNPARPDMTVARAVVSIRYRFGFPVIGLVRLERPRLYGRLVDGRVSFGTLDRVFYAGGRDEPFRLPDMRVEIDDGRGLVRSEYGNLGIKVHGAGKLRNGFAGVIGVVAPRLTDGDCTARAASLYGRVTITREQPRLQGPLRLGGVRCRERDLALGRALASLDLTGSAAFDAVKGRAKLQTGRIAVAGQALGSVAGDIALAYGKAGLNADLDLTGADVALAGVTLTRVGIDGAVRTRAGFADPSFDGSFSGVGLRPGAGLDRQLGGYQQTAAGTLLAPLLAKMRGALAREGSRSTLGGEMQVRTLRGRTTVIVPHAQWQGTGGAMLLVLSRAQATLGDGPPRLAGHFATGGQGMPRISGRMKRSGNGAGVLRMAMAEYAAGDARLAIPAMTVRQDAAGAIRLAGDVRASGAIPGGRVLGLRLPVAGGWSRRSGLALWSGCVTPSFERLEIASLTLQRQNLTLCAPKTSAIVRSDTRGTRFAAGAPNVNLAGQLGSTPATIRGGPVALGVPGTLVARNLFVSLGPRATATEVKLSELTADIGRDSGGNIAGRFADAEIRLASVPLDMTRASGRWTWRDNALTVTDGALRVTDRQPDARFQPMVTRGATLRFADDTITADALLREETTDVAVVDVDIVHRLSSGTGHADLDVAGITFDRRLQPDTITRRALGTIANARGTVTGTGRIDWNAGGVTSRGSFSTDSLDFAAAFGPVKGMSGTVEFTDLLGLVTAPHQKVRIAEMNPGIVVNDGVVDFRIAPNMALTLNDTTFPFMGGTLTMRPMRMNLGVAETRSYIFDIVGLDAAKFVERMELGNIQATGIFDGSIPLIFDENGGRIEGGMLRSRPPGGNISYIGELTYKDLTPIANFAFDALKSLDYTEMTIGLDGRLEGEIVTRVKTYGVKQGAGAKTNFITKRLANLPIRFDVNVRAPFMQLLSSFKSLYDPAAVRDPRELGLVGKDGQVLERAVRAEDVPPADQIIQPSESEKVR